MRSRQPYLCGEHGWYANLATGEITPWLQELLDEFYPAFCLFLKKVNDPKYINRFRMNAGECYVFDNHRIVHSI